MKRSWTNIKVLEPKILTMRAAGKNQAEIYVELKKIKQEIREESKPDTYPAG